MSLPVKAILALFSVVFLGIGVGWWVTPTLVGEQLGMTLLEGAGRATQIADLASFFLTLGGCIMAGIITGARTWFYPAMMLLGLAASGRVHAWLFFDAALTADMIAVEVVVLGLLAFAVTRMRADPS